MESCRNHHSSVTQRSAQCVGHAPLLARDAAGGPAAGAELMRLPRRNRLADRQSRRRAGHGDGTMAGSGVRLAEDFGWGRGLDRLRNWLQTGCASMHAEPLFSLREGGRPSIHLRTMKPPTRHLAAIRATRVSGVDRRNWQYESFACGGPKGSLRSVSRRSTAVVAPLQRRYRMQCAL